MIAARACKRTGEQNKLLIGRGEETEAHVQEVLRLSPRDPWVFVWLVMVGFALD
jgi:hypothetical protein